MTLLTVRHTTTYRYKQPVAFGEHRMMFRPRDSYDQKLLEAWLTIDPEPAQMRWVHDVFGNCVAIAEFGESPSEVLKFESTIWLDHSPSKAPDFEIEPVHGDCFATVGAVSNPDNMNTVIAKAGRQRWKGRMPHNRGITMNPVDHPHGGRTKGGGHWTTPWGVPTKGKKTRKNKSTTKFIMANRHARKKTS